MKESEDEKLSQCIAPILHFFHFPKTSDLPIITFAGHINTAVHPIDVVHISCPRVHEHRSVPVRLLVVVGMCGFILHSEVRLRLHNHTRCHSCKDGDRKCKAHYTNWHKMLEHVSVVK